MARPADRRDDPADGTRPEPAPALPEPGPADISPSRALAGPAQAPAVRGVAPLPPSQTTQQRKLDVDDKTPIDPTPVALLIASGKGAAEPHVPAQSRAEVAPPRGGMALRRLPWLARAWADTESAMRLLVEAIVFYLRRFRSVLLIVGLVLLPVAAAKSCLVAALTGSVVADPQSEVLATVVDLSEAKQDLARRVEASRAQGRVDNTARAELAALEAMAAAGAKHEAAQATGRVAATARWLGAILLTGLLLFGLAVPLANAAVTLVAVNRATGSPLPSFADVGLSLWRRRLRFITVLLPAAVLVAVGCALLLLPGLVVAALLLFAPAVVLFERATGKTALLRSMALVKRDAVRVIVVMLAAFVLSAAAYTVADVVVPESGRRILVFLRVFLGDLLMVVCWPVPAWAAARLYIDLRSREGVDAMALARAARR